MEIQFSDYEMANPNTHLVCRVYEVRRDLSRQHPLGLVARKGLLIC